MEKDTDLGYNTVLCAHMLVIRVEIGAKGSHALLVMPRVFLWGPLSSPGILISPLGFNSSKPRLWSPNPKPLTYNIGTTHTSG